MTDEHDDRRHSGSRWEPTGQESPEPPVAPAAAAVPAGPAPAPASGQPPAGVQTLPPPPPGPPGSPDAVSRDRRRFGLPGGLRGRLLVAAAALVVLLLVMAGGFALGRVTAPDDGGRPDWPGERGGFAPGDRGGLPPGTEQESGDEGTS